MTLRRLIHSSLVILTFALAVTASAQQRGIYLDRTEFAGGQLTGAKQKDGDVIFYGNITPGTNTGVIGFWYRRDVAADLTSDENPLRSDGFDSIFYFQGGSTGAADTAIKRSDLATVNRDDSNWHYIYVKFDYSFNGPPPGGGAFTPQTNITNIEYYLDEIATPIKTPADNGITGHRVGFAFGSFYSGIKFATDQNMVVDDISVWNATTPEVLQIHRNIGAVGMDRFVPTHPNLFEYFPFDGASPALPIQYSDSTRFGSSPPSANTVGTGFYNITVTSPRLVDTSERRAQNIELSVVSEYGSTFVSPNSGISFVAFDPDPTQTVTFNAPEFVYLDRSGNELGSSSSPNQASFLDKAVIRARNVGYSVNGQRTDTGGSASRSFSQSRTENLRIEWLWELEYAVSLDANDPNLTASTANLNFAGNGSQQSAGFGKFWVAAGTQVSATLDGVIGAGAAGDTRYRLNQISIENNNTSANADRYMVFDGTDDFLNLAGAAPLPDFTDFTVEFSMRWDGQERNGVERIMSLHTEVGGGNAVNVYTFGITGVDQGTPNALYFNADVGGGVTLDPSFLDTEWHHWAFSYDKTSQEMKVYRDGQLINTTGSLNLNFDVQNASNVGSLLIGKHSVTNDPFGGALNNLRLWTTPLDQAAVSTAQTTQDFADNTTNLEFEFTFDNDTPTQAIGRGRTTYTTTVSNYTNPYLDALNDAQKRNLIYPSRETRTVTLGDIEQVSSGNLIVDNWIGLSYVFDREFKLELTPLVPGADPALLAGMPYAIVGGQDLYDRTKGYAWVPEDTSVRVGSRYRLSQFPVCATLNTITAGRGVLSGLNDESVVDATSLDSQASREITIPNLTAPGGVVLNYGKTTYRAEIPLGEFLDVRDLARLNAQIVPDLCPGAALNITDGPNETPVNIVAANGETQLANNFVWDSVGQRIVPTAPGIITLEWPDVSGTTSHLIQFVSHLPEVAITNLPFDRENPNNEGYRLGTHPTYDTDTTMASVPDSFPGSPSANYLSLYNGASQSDAIPVELDINPADRWFFKGITYSDSLSIATSDGTDKTFNASGRGRAVALYQYRPDPNQVASGDDTREAYLARVIEAVPHDSIRINDNTFSSGNREAILFDGNTSNFLEVIPANNTSKAIPSSDASYTLDFWAKGNTNTPNDRIVYEQSNSDRSKSLKLGFHSSSHPLRPGQFFLETSTTATENFDSPLGNDSFFEESSFNSVPLDFSNGDVVFPGSTGESILSKESNFSSKNFVLEATLVVDSATIFQGIALGIGARPTDPNQARATIAVVSNGTDLFLAQTLGSSIVSSQSSGLPFGTHRVRLTHDATAQTLILEAHQDYTSGPFVTSFTSDTFDISGANFTDSNAPILISGTLNSRVDDIIVSSQGQFIDAQVADVENWHHYAVSYNSTSATSGIFRAYVDGQLVSTQPGAPQISKAEIVDQVLGKSLIDSFSALGSLDNFRIWDQALNAQEVRNVRRLANPTAPTTPVLNLTGDSLVGSPSITDNAAGDSIDFPAGADINGMLITPAEDTFSEVATRVESKLDTSGFRTAFMLQSAANYNPELYSRDNDFALWGPIFPVNWSGIFPASASTELLWYSNASRIQPSTDTTINLDAVATLHPNIDFPATAMVMGNVDFPFFGKDKDARIYIASRLGSEGVDANGNPQLIIDPASYENYSLYNQPDPNGIGYNPNEEHALIEDSKAASFLSDNSLNLGQEAAFALQADLNQTGRTASFTSEPWVLTQYQDKSTGEWFMSAYKVEKERTVTPTEYRFNYSFNAGDIVVQPYPLNRVVGNLIMQDDRGGNIAVNNVAQRTLWFDKNHTGWVVSGGGQFFYQFWYPFRDDFWLDLNRDGENDFDPGEPFAWVPSNGQFHNRFGAAGEPQRVIFDTAWDTNYPKLKRGETVTFAGGENKTENPLDEGLPAIVAMATTELIYDSATPTMALSTIETLRSGVRVSDIYSKGSARITRPLDAYEASIPLASMPSTLTPAATDNILVVAERWYFKQLVGSLQKRLYYDSLREKLVFRGRVNDREGTDPNLTEQPVSLSIIEPNILTLDDYADILALSSDSTWAGAINSIYLTSQDPNTVGPASPLPIANTTTPVFHAGYQDNLPGTASVPFYDTLGNQLINSTLGDFTHFSSLGTGSALVPTASLLTQNTNQTLYLTVAENNHPDTDAAVSLHIIEIVPNRFRGAIKLVEAQDVFDEKVNITHTGDFGGDTRNIFYEWWIRDADRLDSIGTPETDAAWQKYTDGLNQRTISFTGRPDITLADKMFFVRYGAKDELGDVTGESNSLTDDPDTANTSLASWRLVDINNPTDIWDRADSTTTTDSTGGAVPFQWAGAANSPQLQADGSRKYIPQLIPGWVKRVLDRVNPYEARFADFFNNTSPATYSSQIQIAGGPFIGKVALNSDRNALENVGLIQLYETVLARARELTLDIQGVATDGTNQAVLLAATRLSFLYELLAREAYSDAQNPLVPVSNDNGLADSASFIHAFQNQEASLLHEELALLRGTDFVKAAPSFNRLFWNYVKGSGEAAYNAVYSIQDSNGDGFINEFDAAQQYPQGHGDAWGHFLSANNMHYTLLGLNEFAWQSRDELYSLLDNVIEVDYLDEKSFARIAAAKARTGLEVVCGTYREAFTADPEGQWQGYTDSVDPARAWGVSEWSKRTGQAAYFDWIIGNAVVPTNADANLENLAAIDRQTNKAELSEISGALVGIQNALDEANSGANPAGFDSDSIAFDIDPLAFSGEESGNRKSHFEQIYERAVAAASNAVTTHQYASGIEKQLRKLTDDTFNLQVDAIRQDIDYQNRLIEIFGTPYDGQIGAGKPYPSGYEGPDTLLYQYVDRVDPTKLYPAAGSTRFTTVQANITASSNTYSNLDFQNNFFDAGSVPRFTQSITQIFNNTYLTATPPTDTISVPAPVLQQTNEYAFSVPDADNNNIPDWGSRVSTGKIQTSINELLLEELAYRQSIEDYTVYVQELDIRAQRLTGLMEAQRIKNRARVTTAKATLGLNIGIAVGKAKKSLGEWISKYAILGGYATSQLFPTVIGTSNDATFAGRAGVASAFFVGAQSADTVAGVGTFLAEASLAAKELTEGNLDDLEIRADEFGEIRGVAADLSVLLQQEESKRMAIGTHVQRMNLKASEIKTLIAEGFRIMDEREAFNTTLASKVQRNRYSDMVSRLSRNESLTKYQDAYNNALRYAWLTAKAYDYETSLDSGDPAAATTYFESILKERQLGLWNNGQPQTGNGGLAEILATLKANYDVLEGQIGINNPQLETGLLSMRHEHFRIAREENSETNWQKTLAEHSVPDLWTVPEFRQYCRPFASPTDGAQPGLVIDFTSEINSGKNFFGRELGEGDHAYSSANFTTKISSLGVWFEGYNEAGLATAPRIYLVPVGNDIQRIANAEQPSARQWNVVEQVIPTPFVINESSLGSNSFIPSLQSANGSFADIRRFGDFRAYHSDGSSSIDNAQLHTTSRLIGRSVWNTRWLLIIPGATLHADPNYGVEQFINGVKDIKIQFETYSHEGN